MTMLPLVLLLSRLAAVDSIVVRGSDPGLSRTVADHLQAVEIDSSLLRDRLELLVDSLVGEGRLLAEFHVDSLESTPAGFQLHARAEPGPRFSWSDLEQTGSRLTPRALSRLARWEVGRVAAPADLQEAIRRLEATGWVRTAAQPRLVREPRSLRIRAVLTLEDLPTSSVEALGGWSTGEELVARARADLLNLLGSGRSLSFGIDRDGNGSRAQGAWTEPWLGPLDIALRAGFSLASDSSVRSLGLTADLEGSPGPRNLVVSLGVGWDRRSERPPADTVFAPSLVETSTRLGTRWHRGPFDDFWPKHRLGITLFSRTTTGSDRASRISAEATLSGVHPVSGPLNVQLRSGLRGVWPLDSTTPGAERSSPGGIDGWHGWREGAPSTPSWLWGGIEGRLGQEGQGGLRLFWEPGIWWIRRPTDGQWESRATWTFGGGLRWRAGSWDLDLLLAGQRDTPDWEESLVHLRARNRF